ncbi:hypothetical protein BOW65_13065 [Pseudomonas koreensis]|jgi:hypothetical protein|nr:hypothetical protein BOW65_13065 [Pseudomonas koreensis]
MKYRVELNTAPDQKPLPLAFFRRERKLTEVICERYTDVKYRVELNTEPDQKPLTLALSRRERELIAVIGRGTPT